MHEKTILSIRDTLRCHVPYSMLKRNIHAYKVTSGAIFCTYPWQKKPDHFISQILPWLYIGKIGYRLYRYMSIYMI